MYVTQKVSDQSLTQNTNPWGSVIITLIIILSRQLFDL